MNQVSLIGRMTKDAKITEYGKGKDTGLLARFTLAVDRGKDDTADFISCVAFGKTAELIDIYLGKGSKIGVSGSIQTGSYETQEGEKRYTTDVIVTRLDFCDSKKKSDEEEEEEEEKPKKKYRK